MAKPKPVRTIDVFANPYAGIDHEGVPQGVTQMPGTRNYVGAQIDIVACEHSGKTRFYFVPPEDGEVGAHGLRKVTVPFTAEIARAVLEGGLIVASTEHGKMCGLSEDDFSEAEAQLEAEAKRALAELRAQRGDDATLEPVPMKATPRDDEPVAKAPPADVKKPDANKNLPALRGTPLGAPAGTPATTPGVVIRPAGEGA